ncbi:TFIIB-type zinc ribbon-containing protein [Burkholderia sp. PU8-34]
MKCPVCKTPDLLLAERQSIEIDYCPECRGVWLDRGELDKLIARSADDTPARRHDAPVQRDTSAHRGHDAPLQRDTPTHRGHDDAWGRDRRPHDDDRRHEPHRRKKSVFDIFDFD